MFQSLRNTLHAKSRNKKSRQSDHGIVLKTVCAESLERRVFLSISAAIDVQATAENAVTGDQHVDESTSNPGSATATYQDSSGTVSAQSNGSFAVTPTQLTVNGSIEADEQGQGSLTSIGEVSFSGTVSEAVPSLVTVDIRPTFQNSAGFSTGAFGAAFNGQTLLDFPSGSLDTLSGKDFSYQFALGPGSYGYGAAIIGDTTQNAAATQLASLDFTISVVPQLVGSATVLTSSTNPSIFGQPVTFTATVTPASPLGIAPTGTVTFMDGQNALGTMPLDNTGNASVTPPSLAIGTHDITAVYSGDSNYSGSSDAISQVVNKIGTTTAVASDPNPSEDGQIVTFTATVIPSQTGPTPISGSVAFFDGAAPLGTTAISSSGIAQFSTSQLSVGTHSITAVYSGDGNYNMSGSDPLNQLVTSSTVLPLFTLAEATTLDAQSVTVDYTIGNTDISGPLRFDVYRSSSDSLSGSYEQLGSTTISGALLIVGPHSAKLLPGVTLTANTKMEYVIIVADQNGSIPEAPGSSNSVYFQKFVLGAISHGYKPFGGVFTTIPSWELNLQTDLMGSVLQKNYDRVIAFNWTSTSDVGSPGLAVAAGDKLATDVVQAADSLAAIHAGDVVDLHFIGHSRGAVVVNQAITDLVGTEDLALVGSYIRETLLDPHPANRSTLSLYSAAAAPTTRLLLYKYHRFEKAAADPAIVIPDNVKYVEVYYQHSSYSDFPRSLFGEYALNLWGEGPSDGIEDPNLTQVHWHDLTNMMDSTPVPHVGSPIGPIGHSEVPLWYEAHIVVKGLALSLT